MHRNQNGSVMLIAIAVISSLLAGSMIIWYNHALLYDIAIEKEAYEKRLRLTEGALNIGIAYGKKNIKKLLPIRSKTEKNKTKKGVKPVTIHLGAWPAGTRAYQAAIIIVPEDELLRIHALLNQKAKKIFGLRCYLSKKGEIRDWSFDSSSLHL